MTSAPNAWKAYKETLATHINEMDSSAPQIKADNILISNISYVSDIFPMYDKLPENWDYFLRFGRKNNELGPHAIKFDIDITGVNAANVDALKNNIDKWRQKLIQESLQFSSFRKGLQEEFQKSHSNRSRPTPYTLSDSQIQESLQFSSFKRDLRTKLEIEDTATFVKKIYDTQAEITTGLATFVLSDSQTVITNNLKEWYIKPTDTFDTVWSDRQTEITTDSETRMDSAAITFTSGLAGVSHLENYSYDSIDKAQQQTKISAIKVYPDDPRTHFEEEDYKGEYRVAFRVYPIDVSKFSYGFYYDESKRYFLDDLVERLDQYISSKPKSQPSSRPGVLKRMFNKVKSLLTN